MTTLNTMVKRLHGLVGTPELNAWEDEFVHSCYTKTSQGDDTRPLTERQIEVLERLFNRHFGDTTRG